MLDAFDPMDVDLPLYRLANPLRFRVSLMDLSTTLEDAIETIDFLGADNADDATSMLEMPFALTPGYTPGPTRFSDGTWRVFYSALEPETADAERGHWCRVEIQGNVPATRRFHYRELRCRLVGAAFDLRAQLENWPFLVGDGDAYAQCHTLARSAKGRGADALLCPSARRADGTTVPVFLRRGLSDPVILGVVIIEVDVDGSVKAIRPMGAG